MAGCTHVFDDAEKFFGWSGKSSIGKWLVPGFGPEVGKESLRRVWRREMYPFSSRPSTRFSIEVKRRR